MVLPMKFTEKLKAKKRRGDGVGLLLSIRNFAALLTSNLLGARGCPDATRCNCRKCFEIMVSAAGFETCDPCLKRALDCYHALYVSITYSTLEAQKDALLAIVGRNLDAHKWTMKLSVLPQGD